MTWRYTLPARPDERDVLSARLWVAGARGVWEQPGAIAAWFDDRSEAVPAGGSWEPEPEVDWQASWKATIEPVLAGPVAIVPTWLADDWASPDDVETTIVLDPGQAFGSGHHATTTLCTEALAAMDLADRTVLDVGTGTGVLAIVAARRGAGRVVGVDVDPLAVEVARQNTLANGLAAVDVGDAGPGRIELATGSADLLDDEFDVVVANLVTDVVADLADDLAARVVPGGLLVASGIDARRAAVPGDRLSAAGLVPVRQDVRDGWLGAVWSRPA